MLSITEGLPHCSLHNYHSLTCYIKESVKESNSFDTNVELQSLVCCNTKQKKATHNVRTAVAHLCQNVKSVLLIPDTGC